MNHAGAEATAPLTDRDYWDSTWRGHAALTLPSPSWYPDRRFIELFGSIGIDLARARVLEVGAGASRWLPYLGKTYGADVWGIDYSGVGCELARRALADAGTTGTILEGDLFAPNADLVDGFDLVYSLGLVEHFTDTAGVVGAIARFARPGGLVLTVVPNMQGAMGALQRVADRDVYAKHARLAPADLRRAHEANRLSVARCTWFGSYDPAVVNEGASPRVTERALAALRLASRTLVWATFRILDVEPESMLFSPYAACLARHLGRSA